jgi:predicted Rossmann-fold nucleotide-binding protein
VTVGVLPAGPPPGYPNPWIDIAVHTHLPDRGAAGASERSRNHLNVLSAHVVVILPGGPGTRTELELAQRYGRPVIAYLGRAGSIEGLRRDELPAVAQTQAEVEAFIRGKLGERERRKGP